MLNGIGLRTSLPTARQLPLVIFCLFMEMSLAGALAAEKATQPVLILDQSTKNAPWSVALQSSLQSTLASEARSPIAIYVENLDFGLFQTPRYDAELRDFLDAKYRDVYPRVVVVVGAKALRFAVQFRSQLWPDAPIVFTAIDDVDAVEARKVPNITGTIMHLPLDDLAAAARIVKPDLTNLAIVGDPFQRQPYRGHFADEMAALKKQMNVVDLTGLPMAELRKRVASLGDDTVIAYTNIYGDGSGLVYTPAEALSILAGIADRPIVVDVETFVGTGSVGGFVARPAPIGETAARLTLRVLEGELPERIPISVGDFKKPVFDWRQLRRWHIDQNRLPSGSEIRFRPPTIWEQYHVQITLTAALLLIETALIAGLMYERRRRRQAELETRQRISELAQANRVAAAGVLSASIAHEINQPLTAIVSNGEAGLLWLEKKNPNVKEATNAIREIINQGQRVADTVAAIRSLFKPHSRKVSYFDVNMLIRDAIEVFYPQTQEGRITIRKNLAESLPTILGERTQILHAVSNLVANAIDAICMAQSELRIIQVSSRADGDAVVVTIEDSGPGIDARDLPHIFEAFFTTKPSGTGMGLAICKSIAEANHGSLQVAASDLGGAAFSLAFPRSDVGAWQPANAVAQNLPMR